MPETTGHHPPPRARRASARSLRSAAVSVLLTGLVSVAIPFGLLLGKDGLVADAVNRQPPIPAPALTSCASGQSISRAALRAGQCLRVRGSGFTANELIEVTDSARAGWHAYLYADAAGRFSFRYRAAGPAVTPELLSFAGLSGRYGASALRVVFCSVSAAG